MLNATFASQTKQHSLNCQARLAIPMAVDRKALFAVQACGHFLVAGRALRWSKVFGGGKEALLPSQRKIPGYSLHGGATN
jgi:hypothetical protein